VTGLETRCVSHSCDIGSDLELPQMAAMKRHAIPYCLTIIQYLGLLCTRLCHEKATTNYIIVYLIIFMYQSALLYKLPLK
jgi:hypothetical protein